MFTTFVGVSPQKPTQHGSSSVPAPRPKRSQVHRACDWCRLNRVKCDSSRPCHNCKQIDRRCSNDGLNEFRSLASATKEVERLRAQIRDLERRLKAANNGVSPTPPLTPDKPRLPQEDTLEYYETKVSTWEGIHLANDYEPQNIRYYGPFSLQYFIKRLSSFIAMSPHQPPLDLESFWDSGANPVTTGGLACLSLEDQLHCDYLMKMQQDYFLDLFWQSQHAIYPLVDEGDFRRHYESLWSESAMNGGFRKPSPLVDIILALCIQFGTAYIPRSDSHQANPSYDDARLAGRTYFQRCQALLNETSSPASITAVQCHAFSIMYLVNAGLMNEAASTLATAVQIASTIGLHHDPPEHLPERQRELHRLLWWTLYLLDSHLGMSLGRPWITQLSSATCRLPTDSAKVAQLLGPNYISPTQDITWLSYQSQTLYLINTVRTVHAAFYEKSNDIVTQARAGNFYKDSQAREKSARFLADCMKKLNTWAQQVPNGLKLRRKGGGNGFTTDRSSLEFDFSAPLWLQRQRLLLELRYHNHSMNLYRPFVCFSPTSTAFTPLSDNNAISCLNHAIAITNIVHQTLTETDVLNGSHCVFKIQQNAIFSIVGYACAYPISPPTASARKAITTAISVFEHFGGNFAAAQNAAHLTRELASRVDLAIDNLRSPRFSVSRKPSIAFSDQQSIQSITSASEPVSHPSSLSPPIVTPASAATTALDIPAVYPTTSGADLETMWMGLEGPGSTEMWAPGFIDFAASDPAANTGSHQPYHQ